MYTCKNRQRSWVPLPSIDFKYHHQGGVNLVHAINPSFDDLDDRDWFIRSDEAIVFRISVRGFFDGSFR